MPLPRPFGEATAKDEGVVVEMGRAVEGRTERRVELLKR